MMTKVQLLNRQAWAKALRSGAYQQIHGQLESAAGHCCLGVGCEVMYKRGLDLRYDEHDRLVGKVLLVADDSEYPYPQVHAALGMSSRDDEQGGTTWPSFLPTMPAPLTH